MPQIFMIVSPRVKGVVVPLLGELDLVLTLAVIDGLGSEVTGDVTFTAIEALHTRDEGEIQVEIRFTAGEDEYHTGTPFDPSRDQMEYCAGRIAGVLERLLAPTGVRSFSVWIQPSRGTVFHFHTVPLPKPDR